MGARVVVLEKRDSFSRNNVLHLWPFTIHDLRGLGAKKFYGKFCAGSIDHISEYGPAGPAPQTRMPLSVLSPVAGIRQLQLVLLKVVLMLGAEVHVNVEFKQLLEPPEEQLQQSKAEEKPSRGSRRFRRAQCRETTSCPSRPTAGFCISE